MKIEIGKTYLTRDGRRVKITAPAFCDYPYKGYFEEELDGQLWFWDENGSFCKEVENEDDLVSEVPDAAAGEIEKLRDENSRLKEEIQGMRREMEDLQKTLFLHDSDPMDE